MNTPTQKALIQFAESIVITALIAGIASLSNLFVGDGQINWYQAGITFGFAVLFSLAHSISAYLKAIPAAQDQPDLSGLGTILDSFLTNLQQRLDAARTPVVVQHVAQPQAVQQAATPAPQPQVQQAAPAQPSAPAQIDWSSTNPALKAVNLVPPTQQ